jgi:Methyltransferase FkbM domain
MIKLPVRTLLGLVEEHGFERIDALKADIEGAEDLAILPFMEQAPRSLWPRLIILESTPREWRRNCVTCLEEMGYVRHPEAVDNVVLRLPPETAVEPTRASRVDAHGLVERDLLGAQPAGEGHRLDAGGARFAEGV